MRFELTTLTLARLCSTPELRPLDGRRLAPGFGACKSMGAIPVRKSRAQSKRIDETLRRVRIARKADHAAHCERRHR